MVGGKASREALGGRPPSTLRPLTGPLPRLTDFRPFEQQLRMVDQTKHASIKVSCRRQLSEFDAVLWTRYAQDSEQGHVQSGAPDSENHI